MAGEDVGSIVYQVDMDTSEAISGAQKVTASFDEVQKSADKTSKTLSSLDSASASAGSALGSMSKDTKDINSSFRALSGTAAAVAKSLNDNRAATSSSSAEMQAASRVIESLGNQLAILEEAQQGSARSAAILAAQLRAGDGATESQKKNIADLTGRLYDMRNSTESVQKSGKNLGYAFGQLGYQVQDIAVSLQGGQNALLVFGQQGSQIASIFGPGGAIVGAVLAVTAAVAAALVPSLMKGGDEMTKLKTAAEALDKVVTISRSGVAALSNDYSLLAKTNAVVAAQLRDNAIAEYQKKVEDAGKAVRDVVVDQSSFFRSLTGGTASVAALGNLLDGLNVSSANVGEAFSQISKNSGNAQAAMQTFSATVGMMSSNLGISEQQAFNLIKQLNELAKNPTEKNINGIITSLKGLESGSKDGKEAIQELLSSVSKAGAEVLTAAAKVDVLKKSLNDLQTAAQQQNFENLSKSLTEQKIKLTQGAFAAKKYAVEQMDLTEKQKQQLIALEKEVVGLEEKKKKQKEDVRLSKQQANAQETVAQKLETLRQKSELSAASTAELSREQAILTAQRSLGKNASDAQIKAAGDYAAKAYDAAAAVKAQAAAEKLLPEGKENSRYKEDLRDLNTALSAKKITQDQYNITAERLEEQHQNNLAKIRSEAVVSPKQEAAGLVDPVQALANENAKKLALIQQFETDKTLTEQKANELRLAANMEYEQQKTALAFAQWQMQSKAAQVFGETLDASLNTVSSSITGVLNGTQSINDGIANIANTVLSSLVSSFVQMGAEWVKSAIVGSTAQTTAIATTTAASVAGTATTTAASTSAAAVTTAAWTPAAIVASIGSFGGAAAIGLGAVVAALALSGSLAGKRKNGGPVSAGSTYQVGEGGMPEIYRASSGKQYMIPGDNGSVISNKDMMSSSQSSGIVVYNNITNNSSNAQVSSSASVNADGSLTLATFISDMDEGGPASQAISRNFNSQRKATE